ncbi:hypothetical protein H7097_00790 [Aeromicrobium sp.]|nr:hypothetical protein [Candidatus Saccharibacteria bacterium]
MDPKPETPKSTQTPVPETKPNNQNDEATAVAVSGNIVAPDVAAANENEDRAIDESVTNTTEDPQTTQIEPTGTPEVENSPAALEFSPVVAGTNANAVLAVTSDATIANGPPTKTATPIRRKKKFIVAGVLAGVVLLLLSGGVFGLYLPSRPANVFTRGLERTGTALGMIVNDASQPGTQSKYQNQVFTGKADLNADSIGNISATMDGKTSANATELSIDATRKQTGTTDQAYTLKLISSLSSGKQYPDIYLQLVGIKNLGADAFLPGISQYDGRWLQLSSTYLESASSTASGSATTDKGSSPTTADVVELAKSLNKLANEYILTGDTDKGLLVNQAYLGKDDVAGVSASHYRVGINSANAKKFCTPLADTVFGSAVAKKYVSDESARTQTKTDFTKSCKKQASTIKSSETVDMWIGGKYGLIRQIRSYDTQNKKNYVEYGQKYSGGDIIPFYINLHGDGSTDLNARADILLNKKSGAIVADLNGKGGGVSKVQVHLTTTPSATPPKIATPTSTVDLGKLIEQIQAQFTQSLTQLQSDINDSQTDVQSLIDDAALYQ